MKRLVFYLFVVAMLAGQASADLVGTTAYLYTTDASGNELFWDAQTGGNSSTTEDSTFKYPRGITLTLDNAVFSSTNLQSTGTGVIQPFLKMQAGGSTKTESGYNTTATKMLDNLDSWTYPLQLGWLADVTRLDAPGDTTLYKQFLLDFDHTGKQPPYMQLTDLQIYVGPGLDDYALSNPKTWVAPSATKVYDLDKTTDYMVQMDYRLDPGSGGGDMWVYIPKDAFAGFSSTDNVLLYSKFAQNNDGPEEWAVTTIPGVVVPLPGAVLLGMLGLGAAGLKLRRYA